MAQKILKVGSSAAITLSKNVLEELNLKIGDSVSVDIDRVNKIVSISPSEQSSSEHEKIVRLTHDFVNRYRDDLNALADK